MTPESIDVDTLVVGAGISGIGVGIALLQRGDASFAILDAADDLGGTWRDNTYPGVAVDIPSVSYCFSFETDYPWSRDYATGAEIQRYVRHCAEKYGVTRYIRYRSRVVRSVFDETRDVWATHLDDGRVFTSRYLVAATGLFTQPIVPTIPGLDTFVGATMHTAQWDHGYDVATRRIAVIGTGASAVQVVPELAPLVSHLTVFQRTPIWIAPKQDRSVAGLRRVLRRLAPVRALLRLASETSIELLTFSIVNYRRAPLVVGLVQRRLARLMRRQICDRALAEALVPSYGLGCKRPAISDTYLPAFNRDNVRLVTTPIDRIDPRGIVTSDGALHLVDAIVLATGFSTTERGNAPAFDVIGRAGIELGQYWDSHRRQAYAGVSVAGYPNFFLTAGPYSGGFNWFAMLEANLTHIMDCIAAARDRGATRVEVTAEAHARYMDHIWQRCDGTVFKAPSCASAHSYYLDRHGDPSLPLPHTPGWRAIRGRWRGVEGYRFSEATERRG